MHESKRWRLVSYDIRDPKRWRRVFKTVKGFGESVQYSLFRCRLDDRQVEQLRFELSKILAAEDSLLVVDLCPSCASNVISRNHVEGWTAEPPSFFVASSGDQAPAAGGRRKREKSK